MQPVEETRELEGAIRAHAELERLPAAAAEPPGPGRILRISRRCTTTGESCSITSAGTPAMPQGKAVACRPSFFGRAPVPPQENQT